MDMNQVYEELLGLKELQVNQVVVGATQIEVYCESRLVEGYCPVCLQNAIVLNKRMSER